MRAVTFLVPVCVVFVFISLREAQTKSIISANNAKKEIVQTEENLKDFSYEHIPQ